MAEVASRAVAAPAAEKTWFRRTGAVLAHPLVLLLVGALVTSVLVPSFTRRWQDHQRAIALKAALVTEMTEAAARFVTVAQSADPHPQQTLVDWRVKSAVIEAKLRAYFPNSTVARDWDRYVTSTITFFQGQHPEFVPCGNGTTATATELRAVCAGASTPTPAAQTARQAASLRLQRDAVLQQVLDSNPAG